MPLVRISMMEAKPEVFFKKVGNVVYRTMVDTIHVPPKDNFQTITEHDENSLIYDSDSLDIPRTPGVIFNQITLNEGRSVELKKAFYRALTERLNRELGTRKEDVFVSLVKVKKEKRDIPQT